MNKVGFMKHVSALLALGAASAVERSRLGEWIDAQVPRITEAARAILKPPFELRELQAFADVASYAAQGLKAIFQGADRAAIAQAVFVEAARAVLPDGLIEEAAVNILESKVTADLIEQAYQRLFGPNPDPEAKAAAAAALGATTDDDTLPGITRESGEPVSPQDAQEGAPEAQGAQESQDSGAGAPEAGQ